MSPVKQVKRLRDFLITRTNLYDIIFKEVAEVRYKEMFKYLADKNEMPKSTRDDFIFLHQKEISEETERILLNTCKEVISQNNYKYLFSQIGIFSLFLVPPLYPLIRYIIFLFKEPIPNYLEISVCIVAILLLLSLFCAAAYAVFKATFTQE